MNTTSRATPRQLVGCSILDSRDYVAEQSWCRTSLLCCPTASGKGDRLKIELRYNSYAFQSSGRVYRWDGNQWQLMMSIPYNQLAGVRKNVSYVNKDVPASAFNEDETELIRLATMILTDARFHTTGRTQ